MLHQLHIMTPCTIKFLLHHCLFISKCTCSATTLSWYDLPSFLSHLCLSPTPSPSPSDSIQPCPPAFHHLCSNSKVYSCNYATSMLRLALDYHQTYSDLIPAPRGTIYILPIICLILS